MTTKRKKKSVRKRTKKIPAWLFDRSVSVRLKREVEDGLARHALDNGMSPSSGKFQKLELPDILSSLKLVHARWRAVDAEMINTASQPAMKVLSAHLKEKRRKRTEMEQMIKALEAEEDSAEEGEEEEEEEESSEPDGDQ